MRVVFSFDRERPFADAVRKTPAELVDRYAYALAEALREHYPEHQIEVQPVVEENGDVTFAHEDALTEAERLELALDMRRIAHRLADAMFAQRFSASTKH